MKSRQDWLLGGAAAGVMVSFAAPAAAQSEDLEARLAHLEAKVAAQDRRISLQEAALVGQSAQIRQQAALIETMRPGGEMETMRAMGPSPAASAGGPVQMAQVAPVLPGPSSVTEAPATVGEAPPAATRVEVAALPEEAGVLTPGGRFVLEPSFEYTHGSSNRLVFRGVEIVTGLQIGVIEASEADRTTLAGNLALRYGLTDRLEVEGSLPYVTRSDRVTTVAQRDNALTRSMRLDGQDIGDVEVGARYQINRARPGQPVFIAGLRYKSATGTGPFDVARDEFGVASSLATGSGFWAVTPSLSVIYPTDPAVLFAGVSYLYHAPRDIDRLVGGAQVGEVDPGDAIAANAGFGFALNPQFSFSLGFRYSYILPTTSEIGPTQQESESLQVGSFMFGWSLRLSSRLSLSNSYELGATSNAPDVRVLFRLPYRF